MSLRSAEPFETVIGHDGAQEMSAGETVIDHVTAHGDVVDIADAGWVPGATFDRQGFDLKIEGKDGQQLLIRDYFAQAEPADLSLDGGEGVIRGAIVERLAGPAADGQYAQLDASISTTIGSVEVVDGEAWATRTDGTRVALEEGSNIFMGDVLETASGGGLLISFVDETTFSLSERARMVIDELVYDPASSVNTASFSLVQGLFVMVSGDVAKTGEMVIETPVSTIGIRGTSVVIEAAAEGEQNQITLLQDPNGNVGVIEVSTGVSSVILDTLGASTSVIAFNQPPSAVEILSSQQIETLYSATLATMRTSGSDSRAVGTGGDGDATTTDGDKGDDREDDSGEAEKDANSPEASEEELSELPPELEEELSELPPEFEEEFAELPPEFEEEFAELPPEFEEEYDFSELLPGLLEGLSELPPEVAASLAPEFAELPPELAAATLLSEIEYFAEASWLTTSATDFSPDFSDFSPFAFAVGDAYGYEEKDIFAFIDVEIGKFASGSGFGFDYGFDYFFDDAFGFGGFHDDFTIGGVGFGGVRDDGRISATLAPNASELDASTVEVTIADNNDVYLRGAFAELGVAVNGTIGTTSAAPGNFTASIGGRNGVSFFANPNGVGDGNGGAGDFFLPGTPVENMTLGFTDGAGTFLGSNRNNGLENSLQITLNDVTITNTVTSVLSVGGVEGRMSIEQAVSMGVNDTFYQTDLKFENLGSSTMTNIRYMRNADPDPETDVGSGPDTLNDVLQNPNPAGIAAVNASGDDFGRSVLMLSDQTALNDLNSLSVNVRASAFGFQNLNPFDARAFSSPADPNGALGDLGINLTFEVLSMPVGGSFIISWLTSINAASSGNDVMAATAGQTRLDGDAGNDRLWATQANTSETLDGGTGDDTLVAFSTGNSNGDILLGGDGDDELVGGDGLDAFTGGRGSDIFFIDNGNALFTASGNGAFANETNAGSVEDITDFESGTDTLKLLSSVFDNFTAGSLTEGTNFSVIADSYDGTNPGTNQNHAAGLDSFIYSKSNGILFYDTNGVTAGYQAVAEMGQPGAGDIEIVAT